MRAILISSVLCVLCAACEDEPEAIEGTTAGEPAEEAAEVDEASVAETDDAVATTTGFIEAKVDGELKRYEYLPANHNMVTSRMTVLEALAGPDTEEGIELTLTGSDVRTLDYPAVIRRASSPMRMPALNHRDASGTRYLVLFMDDSLQCQSLEELVLECTFSGTGRSEDDETVALTEGRLEVRLRENAPVDRIMDGLPNVPGQ